VPYSSVVELDHFASTALAPVLAEVWGAVSDRGYGWTPRRADRKSWEAAMAMRALRDHGALHRGAEILGVGAGTEALIFTLTRSVGRVFATDLYLDPQGWSHTAQTRMLVDPGHFWAGSWEPRRLVTQHMDARDLRYPDDSFDGMFSSSSLEHFGGHDDVERAMDEIYRVLVPGGILTLSTELRLEGPGPGLPGILMFDREELLRLVIGERNWELIGGEASLNPSPATLRVVVDFSEAVADIEQRRPTWSTYPHLVLREGNYVWTSVHLTLRKR
jgi:SAM-dependent methyltransferase